MNNNDEKVVLLNIVDTLAQHIADVSVPLNMPNSGGVMGNLMAIRGELIDDGSKDFVYNLNNRVVGINMLDQIDDFRSNLKHISSWLKNRWVNSAYLTDGSGHVGVTLKSSDYAALAFADNDNTIPINHGSQLAEALHRADPVGATQKSFFGVIDNIRSGDWYSGSENSVLLVALYIVMFDLQKESAAFTSVMRKFDLSQFLSFENNSYAQMFFTRLRLKFCADGVDYHAISQDDFSKQVLEVLEETRGSSTMTRTYGMVSVFIDSKSLVKSIIQHWSEQCQK